jgi:hypothetical protein
VLDITERARTIVSEQLAVDPDQVVNDANFIDDLGADSLLKRTRLPRAQLCQSLPRDRLTVAGTATPQ